MNIIPFGPIPPKKPKAKRVSIFTDDTEVYGWISCDAEPTTHTQIFSVDDNEEYCIPPDNTYNLGDGIFITTINGVIQ